VYLEIFANEKEMVNTIKDCYKKKIIAKLGTIVNLNEFDITDSDLEVLQSYQKIK